MVEMKKSDFKKKIESFLIDSGCKRWNVLPKSFIAPNGHRFTVDVEGSIFALFHRESEWGKKDNFFEFWNCPELETNTLNFINERLK